MPADSASCGIRARRVFGAFAFALCACADGSQRDDLGGMIGSLPEWTLALDSGVFIGVSDGPAEQELHNVTGALRLSDGRIIVAEGQAARLRVYDPEGRHLADWGRKGAGPGEFGHISSVHLFAGDSLAVDDALEQRITVLAPDGIYVRMVPRPARPIPGARTANAGLSCCRLAGLFRDGSMLILGPGTVSTRTSGRQWSQHVLLRLSADGARLDTIGIYPGAPLEIDAAKGGRQPYLFGPNFEYAALDDRVFTGNGAADTIAVTSPTGEPLAAIRLLTRRRPVTSAMRQKVDSARAARRAAPEADAEAESRSRLRTSPPPFEDSLPSHSRLYTDRAGRLWVADYQTWLDPRDRDIRFTVFGSGGRAVARARLPLDLANLMSIGEREVVVLARDSLGVEQVRVYPIVASYRK